MSNTVQQGIGFEIKSWQNPFLRVFISEVHKYENKYTMADCILVVVIEILNKVKSVCEFSNWI